MVCRMFAGYLPDSGLTRASMRNFSETFRPGIVALARHKRLITDNSSRRGWAGRRPDTGHDTEPGDRTRQPSFPGKLAAGPCIGRPVSSAAPYLPHPRITHSCSNPHIASKATRRTSRIRASRILGLAAGAMIFAITLSISAGSASSAVLRLFVESPPCSTNVPAPCSRP